MGSNHSKETDINEERKYHTSEGEEARSDGEFAEEYEEEKIQEEDKQIEAKLTDHLGKTCKVRLLCMLLY